MGLVSSRKHILLAGAAACVAVTAQGAQAQDGSSTLLDRITVISRTSETPIEQMASVSQVDSEALAERMGATSTDVLFGVPGISMQSDSRRTASSVNIRGLQDYGRVAVIVDGARQDFQRSGHGTQSTFYVDPEMVETIDVIRGPVANTYGSGAIGGVVYLDTKDADDFLRDGETWALSENARFDSNGYGWTTSTTGAYRFSDSFDAIANLVYRNYGDYTDGAGNKVDGSGFDVLSGMVKTTIRPSENSEIKLGWIGTGENWQEYGTLGPTYDVKMRQNTYTARFNVTDDEKSWLDLHVNVAHNRAKLDQTSLVTQGLRANASDIYFNPTTGYAVVLPAGSVSSYDVATTSFDVWNTSRFETGPVSHELTYGGDWVGDQYTTGGVAGGASFYTPSGNRQVYGAYIQEKASWDWLEVVGALRYDGYSFSSGTTKTQGKRLSPRITVGVTPFEGFQIYGTYAEGYRAPSLSEALISGMHPSGATFRFLPNPTLLPETGKTWEVGVNYARDGIMEEGDSFRLKAGYFHNNITDYIGGTTVTASFTNPAASCAVRWDLLMAYPANYAPICFQYQNYANAKLHGFEMESVYDAAWGFAGLTVSIVDGYTISYTGTRAALSTIPAGQVTGRLGMRFLEKRLLLGSEFQYNAVPAGAVGTTDYTLINLFGSYQANENFSINARVDNLFNVKYANALNATTTSPVFEPGISFKLGATLRFGG